MGYKNLQTGRAAGVNPNLTGLSSPAATDTMLVYDNGASVAATGSFAFGANPANLDTIIINGVTYTFKSSPVDATDVQIGTGATGDDTNLGKTIDNLLTVLNASANARISGATYSDNHTASNKDGTTVIVTFDTKGIVGQSFTLDTNTTNIVRSNPTLAGGVDPILKEVSLTNLAAAIDGILNP